MDVDWKNVGMKALEVVTGLGSVVAGAYGGPAASQGVLMAGGAIKGLVEDNTEKPTRAEQHDRQDFQARAKAPTETPPAVAQNAGKPSNTDDAVARAELVKLGYQAEQIDQILTGPKGQAVASAEAKAPAPAPTPAPPTTPVVQGETKKSVDFSTIASVLGQAVKAYTGNSTDGFEGTTLGAIPATGKPTRNT